MYLIYNSVLMSPNRFYDHDTKNSACKIKICTLVACRVFCVNRSSCQRVVGTCDAVYDLTDDCAYARALGWTLDDDAMSLCNRHQLCYACVSSLIIMQGVLGD